jgi:hypothetical protein
MTTAELEAEAENQLLGALRFAAKRDGITWTTEPHLIDPPLAHLARPDGWARLPLYTERDEMGEGIGEPYGHAWVTQRAARGIGYTD